MIDVASRVLIVVASAAAMELVAALVHRFWMHGPGWGVHRSHHVPRRGRFERNDLYAVGFAVVPIAGFALGNGDWWPLYWVALGMTLYGLLYALVHDGLVHRRLGAPSWFVARRGYLARLVQAHRLHHAVQGRDGAVSFGFLLAPSPARLAARLRSAGTPLAPLPARRQGAVGVGLAALLVAAWCTALGVALFVPRTGWPQWLLAPALVALLTWLNVGLFIVGHDAMHGSLVPSRRGLNRLIGRLCLLLYGGFWFPRFARHHAEHHRHPGTAADPDFHAEPHRFWRWYLGFMRHYTGWPELAGLVGLFLLLTIVLGAPLGAVLLYWALPAVLSSVQLFYFGTYRPHRRTDEAFADAHRARSSGADALTSLLSCFHFGYHHEHHLRPDLPWWRLPALRSARTAQRPTRPIRPEGASTAAPSPAKPPAAPSG